MSEEEIRDESLEEQILRSMLQKLAMCDEFDASSLDKIGKLCEERGLAKPDLVREAVLVKQGEDA